MLKEKLENFDDISDSSRKKREELVESDQSRNVCGTYRINELSDIEIWSRGAHSDLEGRCQDGES